MKVCDQRDDKPASSTCESRCWSYPTFQNGRPRPSIVPSGKQTAAPRFGVRPTRTGCAWNSTATVAVQDDHQK